jgi:hypothetical protein
MYSEKRKAEIRSPAGLEGGGDFPDKTKIRPVMAEGA